MRYRMFQNTITKILDPQEGMNTAIPSHGGGILTLADILDRTNNPPEAGNALEIVDVLDYVRLVEDKHCRKHDRHQTLDSGDLDKRNRRQHLKDLRKLCCTFAILPSSFILRPAFDERGANPFATGGFSDVYEATLNGRRVAIKTLRVTTTTDPEKLHKVSSPVPKPFKVIAHARP
jgi:hypothetical protein